MGCRAHLPSCRFLIRSTMRAMAAFCGASKVFFQKSRGVDSNYTPHPTPTPDQTRGEGLVWLFPTTWLLTTLNSKTPPSCLTQFGHVNMSSAKVNTRKVVCPVWCKFANFWSDSRHHVHLPSTHLFHLSVWSLFSLFGLVRVEGLDLWVEG